MSGMNHGSRASTGVCLCALACVLAGMSLPAAADDTPLAVSTRAFSDVRVVVEASAPGEVHALAASDIPARISAPVEEFLVEVGDQVDQGALIVRLDCADFTDRLEQTEGRLQELEARRTFALARRDRLQRLREQGAVSVEAVEEAVSEVDSLAASVRAQRGSVREAERGVARCDVRAPFSGSVTARQVSAGEWVATGSGLLRLLDPARVELRAHVPYRQLGDDPAFVQAQFRANGVDHAVELRQIVADVAAQRGTREVRLRFVDTPPVAGTPGRLHWLRHTSAVPANLLVYREGELGVMLVEDGHAHFHELPRAIAGRPAAAPTLAADAELIIDGRQAARPGEPVVRVEGNGNGN